MRKYKFDDFEIELDEDKATDDVDGVINFFRKREEILIPEIKKEGVKDLFEQMPEVKELFQHLIQGFVELRPIFYRNFIVKNRLQFVDNSIFIRTFFFFDFYARNLIGFVF